MAPEWDPAGPSWEVGTSHTGIWQKSYCHPQLFQTPAALKFLQSIPIIHLKRIWMHILCKCKAKPEISEGQNISNEIIFKRPLKTENSSSVKDCYPGTELLLRGWAPEHRASHGDLPVDGRSHQLRAAAGGFPSLGFPPQQDEFLKSPVLQTPVFKITFRQLWPIPVY